MDLLDAVSGGCCLRWSATASMAVRCQVGDERHGRCALVSAPCCVDGGEILIGWTRGWTGPESKGPTLNLLVGRVGTHQAGDRCDGQYGERCNNSDEEAGRHHQQPGCDGEDQDDEEGGDESHQAACWCRHGFYRKPTRSVSTPRWRSGCRGGVRSAPAIP